MPHVLMHFYAHVWMQYNWHLPTSTCTLIQRVTPNPAQTGILPNLQDLGAQTITFWIDLHIAMHYNLHPTQYNITVFELNIKVCN